MKKASMKFTLVLLAVLCARFTIAQQPLEYVSTNHLGGLDEEYIIDLKTDSEENVFVLLKSLSDKVYWNDSLICNGPATVLLKYNQENEILFSTSLTVSGEIAWIDVWEIGLLDNGEVVLPGGFRGDLHFGDTIVQQPEATGFICRFNAAGTPAQIKSLVISPGHIIARHIAIDQNNDIYLASLSHDTLFFNQNNDTIFAPYGSSKIPILKLDTDFNLLRLNVLYTDGSLIGRHPITLDGNNNILLSSMFYGYNLYYEDISFQFQSEEHMLFVKIDPSGEIIWAKTAEGQFSTQAYTMCSDVNNNIYFASELNDTLIYDTEIIPPVNYGNAETIVLSLNPEGGFRWYNRIRDLTTLAIEIPPNDIKVKNNLVYVGGEYQKYSHFGNITLFQVSDGYDNYFAKMDAETGEFIWAQGIYGNKSFYTNILAFDFGIGNNIFFSAQFGGAGFFGNDELTTNGGKDVFISKLNETFTGFEENKSESNILVFPNPGNDKFIVQSQIKNLKVQLYNQTGQIVLEDYLEEPLSQSINTSSLPMGLYIYKLTSEDGFLENGKWIKQQ